jgi:hypothetical protein
METQEVVNQSSTDLSKEPQQTQTTPSDSGVEFSGPKSNGSAEAIKAKSKDTPVVPPTTATGVPSPYTPNYKFNHLDKEHEMDEFVRQAIKDKASEEKMRDLYTKAFGLDAMKPRYEKVRDNFNTLKSEHDQLINNISLLDGYYKQGNLDEFFKTLQIPEQTIYKYVLDKLNYQEMPQDQRAQLDNYRRAQQESMMLDRQNQDLYSKYENTNVQLRTLQLDSVMSRPDIKSIVDAFDGRRKETSPTFKERVILEGQAVFNATGKDLSADEAVKRVIDFLDLQATQQPQAQTSSMVATPQAQIKPPVIPNIAGKGTSPAKKVPKNIADLKRMAAALD